MEFVPRTIINGALLGKFISQNVSIHVNVLEEAERGSRSFKGKTSDNVDVTITPTDPLNVRVQGWIEVLGVPSSPDSIRSKEVSQAHFVML